MGTWCRGPTALRWTGCRHLRILWKKLQRRIIHQLKREAVTGIAAYLEVDLFLNKRQASQNLSISISFLEKLMAEEALPFYRVKKKVLFRKHEIDQWIEQYWAQGESQDLKELADDAYRTVLEKQ